MARRSVGLVWLNSWATSTLLITFLLMLPTAYYYGARRAVVLAAVLSLATWLFVQYRVRPPKCLRDVGPLVALLFVASVLVSVYTVRQLGPETGASTRSIPPSPSDWQS